MPVPNSLWCELLLVSKTQWTFDHWNSKTGEKLKRHCLALMGIPLLWMGDWFRNAQTRVERCNMESSEDSVFTVGKYWISLKFFKYLIEHVKGHRTRRRRLRCSWKCSPQGFFGAFVVLKPPVPQTPHPGSPLPPKPPPSPPPTNSLIPPPPMLPFSASSVLNERENKEI